MLRILITLVACATAASCRVPGAAHCCYYIHICNCHWPHSKSRTSSSSVPPSECISSSTASVVRIILRVHMAGSVFVSLPSLPLPPPPSPPIQQVLYHCGHVLQQINQMCDQATSAAESHTHCDAVMHLEQRPRASQSTSVQPTAVIAILMLSAAAAGVLPGVAS